MGLVVPNGLWMQRPCLITVKKKEVTSSWSSFIRFEVPAVRTAKSPVNFPSLPSVPLQLNSKLLLCVGRCQAPVGAGDSIGRETSCPLPGAPAPLGSHRAAPELPRGQGQCHPREHLGLPGGKGRQRRC